MDDFKLNMNELIDIANRVNDEVCRPLGEEVADRARSLAEGIKVSGSYGESIGVFTDPRTGVEDWAHTRVGATVPYAAKVESRHGILGKAAG